MRDALGNELLVGRLVQWHLPDDLAQRGPILRVVDVNEGGVETPNGETTPTITLQMQLPIQRPERGGEIVLTDFLCILDPHQQAALERAMASSSPSCGMMASTGPNTSFCAM